MYVKGALAGCNSGVLGAWFEAIPIVVQAYKAISGGDSGSGACWKGYDNRPFAEPCPNTPNYDAVARAVSRAPDSEVNKIITYLLKANYGKGPKDRAQLLQTQCIPFWVKAILGGKGCVASTFPEAPAWFLSFVQKYGAPETAQEELPGSSIPPGTPTRGAGLAPLAAAGLALFFLPKLLGR